MHTITLSARPQPLFGESFELDIEDLESIGIVVFALQAMGMEVSKIDDTPLLALCGNCHRPILDGGDYCRGVKDLFCDPCVSDMCEIVEIDTYDKSQLPEV